MRCKNNCGAVTKTPNKCESYKKYQLCRPCAIKQGLVKSMKNELIHVRMGKGIRWAKGTGMLVKKPKLTREQKKIKFWETAHERWAEMCYGGSNQRFTNPIKKHTTHGDAE